jgi:uncharacterized protein (UPF0276 family)
MIGLGYRRDMGEDFIQQNLPIDFIEVAPENWMHVGGYWQEVLEDLLKSYPLFTHGLSLSIGSPSAVDVAFVKDLKGFLDRTGALLYSEHLSFSETENAHLYDLLPIPFTEEAAQHVVGKIKRVQDILERRLILENVSYYTALAPQWTEAEFIQYIVQESGCGLLLDVNNVYVNAFNHGYSAQDFIAKMPLEAVAYIHMAGHEQVTDDLIIDTHGRPIIDPVFDLYAFTLDRIPQSVPVLLERDFNIPSWGELKCELEQLRSLKSLRHA